MNVTFSGGPPNHLPEQPSGKTATTPDRKQLTQIVQKLNASPAMPLDRELSWSIDPTTKIPVVRVLDAQTHEVINQFPAEYLIRLTASLESEAASETAVKKLVY